MTKRKSTIKYIVSGCFRRSVHRIKILNEKSIRKELLVEPFIEKTVSSWYSVKKFKRSHQRRSMKTFRNIHRKIPVFSCEYFKSFKNTFFTDYLRVTDSGS